MARDATRLLGPNKRTYLYLHVILDILSRCVAGWMAAERVNPTLWSSGSRAWDAAPKRVLCATWPSQGRNRGGREGGDLLNGERRNALSPHP